MKILEGDLRRAGVGREEEDSEDEVLDVEEEADSEEEDVASECNEEGGWMRRGEVAAAARGEGKWKEAEDRNDSELRLESGRSSQGKST